MIEFVSKGKRLYGAFFQLSKAPVYVAFRRPADLFKGTRGKFITLTQAMQDDTAAWAIDESTLRLAKSKGCTHIGVWIKKLGWVFLTPIENYQDRTKAFSRNYSSKGGELQRYLPLRYFDTKSRALRI
jgi:hypothetical protein